MQRIARLLSLVVALGFAACGGGGTKGSPADGPSPQGQEGGEAATGACSALGECACLAASDRCVPRAESCWCPSCDPNSVCVCGGGKFLGCQDKAVPASCATELTRVQTLCAGKPFVQYIGELCSTNSSCVATCLASNITNVDSCAQIDCYFCPVCDCLPLTPSALRTCLATCN